ncbi:hypothetical protein LUZ60_007528 [Juncus effusus]|nr:hypothetical protein LUZ60_007528 [Juncus effusus]
MAETEDKSSIKIPVFSVLKKGSVLKNIFLSGPGGEIRESEAVLIGRHPDCHIVLDHPSISRFHLEIRAKPSDKQFSVIDRSSVHGTWISGTRIEPNVPVNLREGDLIKLGASTREYRFHWLSLNEAFEMETPLPPLLEEKEESNQDETHQNEEQVSSRSEKEFLSPLKSEQGDLPILESESIGSNKKGDLPILESESIGSNKKDDLPMLESESIGSNKKGSSILSRRSKSKSISSLTIQTGKSKENVATKEEIFRGLFTKLDANVSEGKENVANVREEIDCKVLFGKLGATVIGLENEETFDSDPEIIVDVREEEKCKDLFAKLGVNLIELDNEESFASDKENMTPQGSISKRTTGFWENVGAKIKTESILGEISENFNTKETGSDCLVSNKQGVKTKSILGKSVCILREMKQNSGMKMKENGNCSKSATKSGMEKRNSITEVLLGNLDTNETEYFDSDKENLTPQASKSAKKSRKMLGEKTENSNKSPFNFSKAKKMETPNLDKKGNGNFDTSPSRRALLQNVDFKGAEENCENLTPVSSKVAWKLKQPLSENCVEMSPVRALLKNADSKFGDEENCENFPSDKENLTPVSSKAARKLKQPLSENLAEKSPVRALFKKVDSKGAEEENCEIFSSDKENMTPVNSKSARKLKQPVSENRANVEKEINKKKMSDERIPFGVLFDASQNTSFNNCGTAVGEKKKERKVWNMVVDTGCLLNEESFKAVKLLQALKGTRLVIPIIVIRELDCMKRRETLLTRSRKASRILKWIEECMGRETENWWVHVQSSSETLPVAPTPPVTPTTLYGLTNNSTGFVGVNEKAFSPCGGYTEIVTPTSEDHVLDCAQFFRKLRRKNEEIVIVSGSTTLKIKAMAEGLFCESAKEFRESLVNPHSKRFMWATSTTSSPGNDDVEGIAGDCNGGNRSGSNPIFARRAVKAVEAVKGLKLILHHNSHYGLVV